jgi:hypothetical protein
MSASRIRLRFVFGNRILHEKGGAHSQFSYPEFRLFKVNTGLRAQGVCWLRWDWEFEISELNTSVFITPGKAVQYADGLWPGERTKKIRSWF